MDIQIERLGRSFSGVWGLKDVNATIRAGTISVVVGANGAGKSTLLRLAGGRLCPTEGTVRYEGRLLRHNAVSLRRKSMLLDVDDIPFGGVCKIIASTIVDYSADRGNIEEVVSDWLRRFEIQDLVRTTGSEASKGQAYKARLVSLFSINPPIWLLDEPMSAGLDANGLMILEEQMMKHRADGGTVVFTSQWPRHAVRLADDCLILDQGKLLWQGAPTRYDASIDVPLSNVSLRAVIDGLTEATDRSVQT
ncbi:MAG: ATP-binding cassette domain-containing protein [Planctomycetales bacterium]|nr:ATP-binding cassette domain-containing protein [Planctomycetales bacterium]